MCDAASETLTVMKSEVPCLMFRLKKSDTTLGINALLHQVRQCFFRTTHSVEFQNVMIGALVLIEKGFLKQCYIHSRTALR
jgi:hypothetical protein